MCVCVCVSVWPQSSVDEEPEEMPPPDAETVQVIPGSELLWKITPRPDNSAKVREEEQYVNLTKYKREFKIANMLVCKILCTCLNVKSFLYCIFGRKEIEEIKTSLATNVKASPDATPLLANWHELTHTHTHTWGTFSLNTTRTVCYGFCIK